MDEANGKRRRARRAFIKRAGAAGLMSLVPAGVRTAAWAAGSDVPEKPEVRIGFIPLTDCSSVVMAAVKGFDKKYGVRITPTKEASWATIRDKLVNGELDAAHVLYGLVYGVHLGIGGLRKDMAVLMTLNHNGQGITLSRKLQQAGVTDGRSLAGYIAKERREYTFAQTFPTGTHAMWLYYWLAAHGINPLADARVITVPPPQMVASMRLGHMDGYCVGEPWNQRAIVDGVGFSVATSQEVWRGHPEKVLGATAEFVRENPNTARAMTAAVLEASRYIDTSPATRRETAAVVAGHAYVNTDVGVILGRMLGRYENGLGRTWDDPDHMRFHDGGAVNFPYLSDAMWFMTQFKRWGLLPAHPDYAAVARTVNRLDIYGQAAAALGVPVPPEPVRAVRLMDGLAWSGRDPKHYAQSHEIHA